MAIAIQTITFVDDPKMPGVRQSAFTTLHTDEKVSEILRGFRLMLRGPSAFFVSPKGWHQSMPKNSWDPEGPVKIFEIPRSNLHIVWQADKPEELAAIQKGNFDSQPFGKPIEYTVQEAAPRGFLAGLDAAPTAVPAHEQGDA